MANGLTCPGKGAKEVLPMSKDHEQGQAMSTDKERELETVDITDLDDEELDDVIGGAKPLTQITG